MKRAYKKIGFGEDKKTIIGHVNRIVTDYQRQGYRLSLRQVYYKLVAGDLFLDSQKWRLEGKKWVRDPDGTKNAEPNYKWLGSVLGDARMAGLVDWSAIEDRTREVDQVPHWASPADVIRAAANSFRLDKWADQPTRLEVWVEKDALEGIVVPAAHSLDVGAFSCRGYGSLSSMWEASRRLRAYIHAGQRVVIIHLGDHDPSGIDMTRDIQDRLNDFVCGDWLYEKLVPEGKTKATNGELWDSIEAHIKAQGVIHDGGEERGTVRPITVLRIALTREQVDEYNPPPNPAKVTDSRYAKYREEHGDESWELDALEPTVLADLITNTILEYRDENRFEEMEEKEGKHREGLTKAARAWDKGLSAHIERL